MTTGSTYLDGMIVGAVLTAGVFLLMGLIWALLWAAAQGEDQMRLDRLHDPLDDRIDL